MRPERVKSDPTPRQIYDDDDDDDDDIIHGKIRRLQDYVKLCGL